MLLSRVSHSQCNSYTTFNSPNVWIKCKGQCVVQSVLSQTEEHVASPEENNQYSWKWKTVSFSSTVVGVWEDMVSLSSRSPFPFISLSSVPVILTSADTDQVASSQWVSMEPSNRKQVRPDAPASMLNVAVKKHWALFWPCQATSAQDLVRGAEDHFHLRSLFQHLWCECVSIADLGEPVRCIHTGGHQSTTDRSTLVCMCVCVWECLTHP